MNATRSGITRSSAPHGNQEINVVVRQALADYVLFAIRVPTPSVVFKPNYTIAVDM